jgi:hypothetical protein
MRIWVALALLAPGLACAGDGDGFAGGGVGWTWRDVDRDVPFDQLDLGFDDGLALHAEGGARIAHGLLLRGSYTYADHGTLAALGTLTLEDDVQQRDLRLGAFHETAGGASGFRLGGGFAHLDDDVLGASHGAFLETAWIAPLGERVTLDLAAAYLRLTGDSDRNATELRARFAWRAGGTDFTLDGRYTAFDTRTGPSGFFADYPDEQIYELRFGVMLTGI